MKSKLLNKGKIFDSLFALGVFAAMLVFFGFAHKLVVLDADDWTYIAQTRMAIPALRFWNPSRILPETLMPWSSSLGVLLLMPLVKDYISSLALTHAIVLSAFICAYVLEFYKLVREKLKLESVPAAFSALLFLLIHFWVYRTANQDNTYLFLAPDLTCIFYYVIPTLLNASLVMYFMRKGSELSGSPISSSVLLLLVYLAIYSNLYSSIVLAVYMGLSLLQGIFKAVKDRVGIAQALKKNVLSIFVLMLWLSSLVFEGLGERGQADAQLGFFESLSVCAALYPGIFTSMNKLCVLFCSAFCAAAAGSAILKRGEKTGLVIVNTELLLCFVLVSVFLVLLSAKVNARYILRTDVALAMLFFLIALSTLCLAYVLKRIPKLAMLLPLMTLIVFSSINCPLKTFNESNDLRIKPEIIMELDRNILEQAIAADKQGLDEAELHVLSFGPEAVWPHDCYIGERISAALFKHGMISKPISFTVVPDPEMNELFGLSYYN